MDSKTPEESNNSNWKVHLDPVLREKSDFIIAIKLDPLDDDNLDVWEQMWAKRLSENRFSLCCIPFFAYHLALGDEVETDKDFNIIARVKPSGHLTYRVWFDDPWNKDIRYNVLEHCDRIGLLTESYSYNLLGISAASPIAAESIYAFLRLCESQGLLDFEAGF